MLIGSADHVVGGGNKVFGIGMTLANTGIRNVLSVDELSATPFLALRSRSRRAITTDPDHPDGYYALAVAFEDENLPLSAEERNLGRVTALRQFLMRLPPPERYKPKEYLGKAVATRTALQLTAIYLGKPPGSPNPSIGMPVNLPASARSGLIADMSWMLATVQAKLVSFAEHLRYPQTAVRPYFLPLDVARETLQLAEKYAPIDYSDSEEAKRNINGIREWQKQIDSEYNKAINDFEREKERDRIRGARSSATRSIRPSASISRGKPSASTDPGTDLGKEFGRQAIDFAPASGRHRTGGRPARRRGRGCRRTPRESRRRRIPHGQGF